MKKIIITILLASPLSMYSQNLILGDDFNDNDRMNQDLPNSAQWFSSTDSPSNNLSVVEIAPSDYALQNAPTSGTVRHAIAYFASIGTPVSLSSENQSISLSFDLTPTSRNPNDNFNVLRIGLMNSGINRQTIDAQNPSLSIQGYGFFINPVQQRVRTYGRTEDEGPLFSSLASGSGWVGEGGGLLDDTTIANAFPTLQNVSYTIGIEFTRDSDDNIFISYEVTDGNQTIGFSFIDDSYLNYDFDTVGFAWNNTFGDGLIDNVLITYVPEPATVSFFCGILGLFVCFIRKYRFRDSGQFK